MAQLKRICEKIILLIITISLLITFCAMPSSYAKLDLQDGEFYYAGTQKGQYTVSEGIFEWLLSKIGDIADWILGIITMGFRMVFVGWTALLEKMLTWGLESVAGVNTTGDVVESNTDLTSITDSTNNVTMEAIVYNHVAGLDANIFNLKEDVDDLKYTGTGRILKCEECGEKPEDDVTKCCSAETGECSCDCNCDDCNAYKEAVVAYNERQNDDTAKKPIIFQVKESVAMWYYIIRTLAIAAMLVVLIAVGIKMAVSNVAGDKAVYKRMLVDWVVGMIILFSMHYIMIFTFYINESLVGVIENAAHSINNVKMMELAEKNSQSGVEYTDSEIEIKVYEAVRTRAYDAKLINGLSGTIMYMTLVYFAFRYTIVYLKRMFTIMVLTIMAPGVGVGYAVQKALTGKQKALKTWLSEYVLNVIIQVVHALIYSIFISQALVLSLESISGIIVALILMNYTLKADALFRKIFKISTGGLVDDTNNSLEQLKSSMSDVYVGGKSAINTLTKESPYTKAVAGIGKAVVAAPFLGAGAAKEFVKSKTKKDTTTSSNSNSPRPSNPNSNPAGSGAGNNSSNTGGQQTRRSDQELLQTGKKTIEKNLEVSQENVRNASTPEEQKAAMKQYNIAVEEYARYDILTNPTTKDIAKAHISTLFDINENFVMKSKTKKNGNGKNMPISSILASIYGNNYIDTKTGKKVNDGTGFYNQLKPSNLFGLSKDQMNLLKKQAGISFGTIAGMASMFFGLGTVVAHPTVGMGLLASGGAMTHRGLGRPTTIDTYKGRYTFSRFSIPAMRKMRDITLEKAQLQNKDLKILSFSKRHPKFVKGMELGTVTAATLGAAIGGVGIVPATLIGAGFMAKKFIPSTNIGQGFVEMEKLLAKEKKAQEKEFKIESLKVINAETQARMETIVNGTKQEPNQLKMIYAALGYDYNPKTGEVTLQGNNSDEFKQREEFENKLEAKMKNNIVEDDIVVKNVDVSKLTQSEIKLIDKQIDEILVKISAGKELDLESEAVLDSAMKELTTRLNAAGVIENTEKAENVFKEGKAGLKKALKEKGDLINKKLEVAAEALEGIEGQDKEAIKDSISEISKTKGINDFKQITATEVLAKLNASRTKNGNNSNQLTNEEMKTYGKKVAGFLAGLELAKDVTHESDYQKRVRAKKSANDSARRRKNKMKQILEMTIDNQVDDPTEELIQQVNNVKSTGGIITDSKGNAVQVASEEANQVLELLFLRKELEVVNQLAVEEVKLEKGSYGYNQSVKAKTDAAKAYYADKLSIEYYALNNNEIYSDPDYRTRTDKYTQEQINERMEKENIEKNLQSKYDKMKVAERNMTMKGPIVDINTTVTQLLNNKR